MAEGKETATARRVVLYQVVPYSSRTFIQGVAIVARRVSCNNVVGNITLAIGDAGTVPYYSDWQVIDLFGLNSKEVAFGTIPVSELVLEAQPADLILLSVGANPNRISDEHAGSQRLFEAAVRKGLDHIGTFAYGRVNNIWVIGRSDTELANYLQENMDFK